MATRADRTGRRPLQAPFVLTELKGIAVDERLLRAEALYRAGQVAAALQFCKEAPNWSLDHASSARMLLLRGKALVDFGNAIESIARLKLAVEGSRRSPTAEQFNIVFNLFVRETQFQAPPEIVPALARLRQLACLSGDARSLAGLHLAVARLEGCRGHCTDAHRHLEIARRLANHVSDAALLCSVDLVEASLASVAGNLVRSRRVAERCF